jgi:hypothetical protein
MGLKLKNVYVSWIISIVFSFILFEQEAFAAVPSVPTGVSAAVTCNSLTVSWPAVSGATSYNVSVNNDVRSTTYPSYTYAVAPGTNYDYAVRANNSSGSSAYSSSQSITTHTPPSGVPSATATATSNSVTVQWSAVSGATEYTVYLVSNSPSYYDSGIVSGTTPRTFTFVGLTPGITYSYSVLASNSYCNGNSSSAQPITTSQPPLSPPQVPTGVSADVTCNSVAVRWSAVSGATSYDLSIDNKVMSTTSTSYPYAASPGTTYNYMVRANNSGGSSAYSPSQPATTPSIPSAPSFVIANDPINNSVTISWGITVGAASYDVRISKDGGVNWDTKNTTGTAQPYSGLSSGTYNFAVRANNNCGSSSYISGSKPFVIPPSTIPPSTPTGVSADVTCNSVIVRWSAVSGATNYDLSIDNKVMSTTSTSYTYAASPGTTYNYMVRANNSGGSSAYSPSKPATTLSIPSAPSFVIANEPTNKSVTISWGVAVGAASYDVRISKDGGVNWDTRNTTGTAHPYSDLSPGTYNFAVRANSSCGSSPYISGSKPFVIPPNITPPSTPTGVNADVTCFKYR